MTKIGTTKTLKNGYNVSFRKATPSATYNAIKRELKKRGYEIDDEHKARTGSRYLEMSNGEISVEVRSSDHTYGISESTGISIQHDWCGNGDIWGVEIDLAALDINTAEFRAILDDIEVVNKEHMLDGATSADLSSLGGISEILASAIKESVKSIEKYK